MRCIHEALPNTLLGWPCCSYGLQQTPHMVLYGELEEGSRHLWGTEEKIERYSQESLKFCSIPPCELETLAADCVGWRHTVSEGIDHFEMEWIRTEKKKRRTTPEAPSSNSAYWSLPLYLLPTCLWFTDWTPFPSAGP